MTKTAQYYLCNRVATRNPIQCAAALYIYVLCKVRIYDYLQIFIQSADSFII
jgi:hypothetical protein